MNWNEIETKWAAMSRRVGFDQRQASGKPGREEDPPTTPPGDFPQPTIPDAALGVARA